LLDDTTFDPLFYTKIRLHIFISEYNLSFMSSNEQKTIVPIYVNEGSFRFKPRSAVGLIFLDG